MKGSLILSMASLGLLVLLGLGVFRRYAEQWGFADIPNHRSSHDLIKPRAGGLIFMLVWLCWMTTAAALHWISWPFFLLLVPSMLLISTVGLLDDRYSLSARWRLLAHALASGLFLWQLGPMHTLHLASLHVNVGAFGTVLAFLALLWSINLFNFMDGTDGLAGVEALTVLGMSGLFTLLSGATEITLAAWSLAACVCGFLWWNWPPAKLFMGDVGSTALGFILVALALYGQHAHDASVIPWMILYSAFFYDATTTLLTRLWRREKLSQAHRSHAYQRLLQASGSHRTVLWTLIGLNIVLAGLAYAALCFPSAQWLALVVGILLVSVTFRTAIAQSIRA